MRSTLKRPALARGPTHNLIRCPVDEFDRSLEQKQCPDVLLGRHHVEPDPNGSEDAPGAVIVGSQIEVHLPPLDRTGLAAVARDWGARLFRSALARVEDERPPPTVGAVDEGLTPNPL